MRYFLPLALLAVALPARAQLPQSTLPWDARGVVKALPQSTLAGSLVSARLDELDHAIHGNTKPPPSRRGPCSAACTCGCNQGEPCDCRQRAAPFPAAVPAPALAPAGFDLAPPPLLGGFRAGGRLARGCGPGG